MRTLNKPDGLFSVWAILLIALLAACGSDTDGKTVAVNLSLIVDARQAEHRPAVSRLFAWIDRWFPGATPVWAQAVSDIASIQVEITGPGIPAPASTIVPVSDPTSGQEIPVSIQAPVGPNRTITVSAFNAASPPAEIFGGTLPGVNLAPGAPVNLEITMVRLFTVTVQKQGNGSGTITSSPAGIDCGAACSGQFQEGMTVSLNAAAAPGSAFAGWGGDCSGTGPCTVDGNGTVTARFEAAVATNRLSVVKTGNGSGAVTSNPSGILCGAVCSADFPSGSSVVLEAAPDSGSTLTWSGAGCSGSGGCVVVMIGDQTVTATFTAAVPPPSLTLTVTIGGAGAGTVISNPSGISCPGTCSANFSSGSTVALSSTPAAGSMFTGWGGDCSGTGSCSVVMDVNRSVTAAFNPASPDFVTLTADKQGSGDGTITSDPPGISCGPGCNTAQASYLRGTPVTLTATPDGNSTFDGWRGECVTPTLTCGVVMNNDATAIAHFGNGSGGRGPGGG